jgi:PIN domain nuclease of toxin-antitoxin system
VGQFAVILLDTHVVIWLAIEPARISRKARSLIEENRQRGEVLAISDVTLLEIATLEKKRRVKFDTSLETFLSEVESRFAVLPITARVCVRAMGLPPAYPKDPADRVIAATALVEGVPLLTADDEIRSSRIVSTVW